MPVDSYMLFLDYQNNYIAAESQVDLGPSKGDTLGAPFLQDKAKSNIFEVDTFDFDVEQTINMSSQASGAGAGKIQFNPFKITRKIDKASPTFFQMACQGRTFQQVNLGFRKASGVTASGLFFLRFDFVMVAIKTISWSHGDDSPTENLEFEYGGLGVVYSQQNLDGSMMTPIGNAWNKLKNTDLSGDYKTSWDMPAATKL